MTRRLLAAGLWFYAVWCGWALAASVGGWTPFLGPVIAAGVSAAVAGDPLHRIWAARQASEGESKLASIASQS
jgi:hypothetical protein